MSLLLCIALAVLSACSTGPSLALDPRKDPFYDMTRHIMTAEEEEIYRHLPDLASRKEFAREFWERRDPDPTTEENEALVEFQNRIDFANRTFNEHRGQSRGWDSLRGRILLQLGYPDERNWGTAGLPGDQLEVRHSQYETWLYYRHQLRLVFVDRKGFGTYEFYGTIPAALGSALQESKLNLSKPGQTVKNPLKFSVRYADEKLIATIPTKVTAFDEDGDRVKGRYTFNITFYKDYRKVTQFTQQMTFSDISANVVSLRELTFTLPLPLSNEGNYLADIILKDEQTGQRSRNFCKIRK